MNGQGRWGQSPIPFDRLTDVSKPCCIERIPGPPGSATRVLVSNIGDGTLRLVEVSGDGHLKLLHVRFASER